MTAYVIAHLQDAAPHTDIAEYMERVAGTFKPHGGRFLVHGKQHETLEGNWPGGVVMVAFPSLAEAQTWWNSPAYQDIAPLRSRHIEGDIILVEGVPDDYETTAAAQAIREAASAE